MNLNALPSLIYGGVVSWVPDAGPHSADLATGQPPPENYPNNRSSLSSPSVSSLLSRFLDPISIASAAPVEESSAFPQNLGLGWNTILPFLGCFLFRRQSTPFSFIAGLVAAAYGTLSDLSNEESQGTADFWLKFAGRLAVGAFMAGIASKVFRTSGLRGSTTAIYDRWADAFTRTKFAEIGFLRRFLKPAFAKFQIPGDFGRIRRLTTILETASLFPALGLVSWDLCTDNDPYSDYHLETPLGAWGACWSATWLVARFSPIHTVGYFVLSVLSVYDDYTNQQAAIQRTDQFRYDGVSLPGYNGTATLCNWLVNLFVYGVLCDNLFRDGAIRATVIGGRKTWEWKIPEGVGKWVGLKRPVLRHGERPDIRDQARFTAGKFVYSMVAAPLLVSAGRWVFYPDQVNIGASYMHEVIGSPFMVASNFFAPLLGIDRPKAKLWYSLSYFCLAPMLASASSYYDVSPDFYRSPLFHLLDKPEDQTRIAQARRLAENVSTPATNPVTRYFGIDWAKENCFGVFRPSKETHIRDSQTRLTDLILSEKTPEMVQRGYLEILRGDIRRLEKPAPENGNRQLATIARLRSAKEACRTNRSDFCHETLRILEPFE